MDNNLSSIISISTLYLGADELISDDSIYTISEAIEQDCRRYAKSLCDERGADII